MFSSLLLAVVMAMECVALTPGEGAMVLAEVSKSLHGSSPLRIQSELVMELVPGDAEISPIQSEPVIATIDLGDSGAGVFQLGEYTAFIEDNQVVVIREGIEDAYLRCRPSSTPAESIQGVFESCPFPMLALAFPSTEVERTMRSFLAGGSELGPPKITRDSKGQVRNIVWVSPETDLSLLLDADTGRPLSGQLEQRSGVGVPPGAELHWTWTWTYGPTPGTAEMRFERGNRFRVDRLSALKRVDEGTVATGGQAPELVLPTLAGSRVDLAQLRGRVVVIDFWATWCGPCRRALPQLQTLSEEMAGEPVTVLTVNCFERLSGAALRESIEKTSKDLSLSLPVLMDETGAAAQRWGVEGIPATFVIGRDGRIAGTHTGFGPDYLQDLRSEILAALAH